MKSKKPSPAPKQPHWKAEYGEPATAVVIVVVANDWWEARLAAVQRLGISPDQAFSPTLLVSKNS